MLSMEFVFENLKELQALRDEYESPVFVDFALRLLEKKPDYPLIKFHAALTDSEDPVSVLQAYFNDFFADYHTPQADSQSLRNPDCPFKNAKAQRSCCCQKGLLSPPGSCSEGNDTVHDTRINEDVLGILSNVHKANLEKYIKSHSNETPFTDYLNNALEHIKSIYETKGWEFKITFFFESTGGITYAMLRNWLTPGNKRKTRPDLKSVIGFMIATQTFQQPDTEKCLEDFGFTLSHQFDFDLTVLFFLSLQNSFFLDVATFNEALVSIGVPRKIGYLLTSVKEP